MIDRNGQPDPIAATDNGRVVFSCCPRLLSIEGAAAYLGISETKLREFVHRLPRLRCGRRILFDRRALDEYVDYFRPDQDISIDKRIESS